MKTIPTLIAASALLAAAASAQKPAYTLIDLGTLPGGDFSQAGYIDDNGLIAGVATTPDGTQHAVLWHSGTILEIAPQGKGPLNSAASGVIERGRANGLAEVSQLDPNGEDFCGYGTHLVCLPFVWQPGVFPWQPGATTPLPTLGGNNGTVGNMNRKGEVVGIAETSVRDNTCPAPQQFRYQAVVWGPKTGEIRELRPLPGDTVGEALWINDHGQAVGASGLCSNSSLPGFAFGPHAVLWEKDGTPRDLGNLGGSSDLDGVGNMALAINNVGEVAGVAALPGNQLARAFLWTARTGMHNLGTLPGDSNSAAVGLNDRGEAVGISYGLENPFAGPPPHPWVLRNGVMTDLNTLIQPFPPLAPAFAGGINARGQIAGWGLTRTGEIHAFLATPSDSLDAAQDPPR